MRKTVGHIHLTVVLHNFPNSFTFSDHCKKWRRFTESTAEGPRIRPELPLTKAMLTAVADGLEEDRCWLRADPMSLQVDLVHIYLLGNRHVQLQAEEIELYRDMLNSYLQQQQIELVTPCPQRWYVELPQLPDIRTYDPSVIVGHAIHDYLLTGNERIKWLQLFNELQMLLYTSVVNKRRVENGLPSVDALWFWGEELVPRNLLSEFIKIFSNAPLAAGLAKISKVPYENISKDFNQMIAQCDQYGNYLIYIDFSELPMTQAMTEQDIRELLETWFNVFRTALRKRHLSSIDFYPGDGYGYRGCARRWRCAFSAK